MTTNIVPNQVLGVEDQSVLVEDEHPGHSGREGQRPGQAVDGTVPVQRAQSVLNNTADVFDWADVVPGSLLPQIKAKAGDRFSADQHGRLDVLHLHEHDLEAVQQSARTRGGCDRPQPDGDESARFGHARSDLLLPAARRPRLSGVRPRRRARMGRQARGTWPRPSSSSSSPGWPARRSRSGARAARHDSSG